ncbi:hypothetical protein HS041_28370 [Planomonospora sp. ID67723]|uniref:hypothetical protein n=1 Tax=Planomonospora sp. ID67723 TaxID=2738134 RepID=UPI0018C36B3C|nr:hypothetical protein [Planomonospora sp. ID67723]MBG0831650.1 hypothetical protein [Planomonospora sp. ID67723]
MTDPIICPECGGDGGQRVGRLRLACRFCGGLGRVGGEHEPAERGGQEPPAGPPAVWEHRIWTDPVAAAALGCRRCLGAGTITHLDRATRTLTTAPCECRTPDSRSA